jgi:hypothetical protein
MAAEQIFTPDRSPVVAQARSLLCCLMVRDLGVTATELAGQRQVQIGECLSDAH